MPPRERQFYTRLSADNDDWIAMAATVTGLGKAFILNAIITEARRRGWSFTDVLVTTTISEPDEREASDG